MDSDYFLGFARRCRDLASSTRNLAAKEQLCLWAEEFEARANAGSHENLIVDIAKATPVILAEQAGDGEEPPPVN